MRSFKNYVSIFIVIAIASCAVAKTNGNSTHAAAGNLVVNGKIWSSLFQQTAAEYNALCYQAYNAAKAQVDEALKRPAQKPLAIITDVDETVLDNSPYAVHRALEGKDFSSDSWYEWTKKGSATPMAGSIDFFNYAAGKGITVFYVTNRDEKERAGTLANLKRFNYPFSDDAHLILRQTSSSKEERRLKIASTYNIIMFIGDNLSDFSAVWDKKPLDERSKKVDDNASLFGKKFIMLSNFNYGGWEDALYGNRHSLTPAQKDSAIKANLKSY